MTSSPKSDAPRGLALEEPVRVAWRACCVPGAGPQGMENPWVLWLRQGGTCVTSVGECLQVTVTMSKQGTLGLVHLGEPSERWEGRSRLSQLLVEPVV